MVNVPFKVDRPHHGLRIDRFLAERLHRYSRAEVQRLIVEGRVWVRERLAKASTKVADGDTVVIRYPRRDEPPAVADRLDVVYEDGTLLAVNKPAGMLTHPTDKVTINTVTGVLKRQFPGLALKTVHRLDRETSGVLVMAKDARAARKLTDMFTDRAVAKEYWALVRGRFPAGERTVDLPIGREGGAIKVRQSAGASDAVEARTDFTLLAASDELSLVSAKPRTGRLHQIRVHLSALGFPIVGDKLYIEDGGVYMKAVRGTLTEDDLDALGAGRQMLHARRITLTHPATKAPLTIKAPLPADFASLLADSGLTVK